MADWLGRDYWGKGPAAWALATFLEELATRPLYAGAAEDNLASIRVLEKCGFTPFGRDKAFAHARGEKVEEVILKLGWSIPLVFSGGRTVHRQTKAPPGRDRSSKR